MSKTYNKTSPVYMTGDKKIEGIKFPSTTTNITKVNTRKVSLIDVSDCSSEIKVSAKDSYSNLIEVKTLNVNFIDLGIVNSSGKKVLFADRNIGANSPEEYGKYFQWGDTVGYEGSDAKTYSNWSTAPFNNGSSDYDETYFASVIDSVSTQDSNGNYNLNAEYDAATVAYGEGYRLPTYLELKLLQANTTSTWEVLNGVNGIRLTSMVDITKSIFFPAAGFALNGSLYDQGNNASVWSSSLYTDYPSNAWYMDANSGGKYVYYYDRYSGYSVRGVLVQD